MAASPVTEMLGQVAIEFTKIRPLLPTYLHLLLSALFPIYTAAHASLARPPSAAPPGKWKGGEEGKDADDEVVQKIESLSIWDALTFPLLAGATLTSLYFLIKWLQDPALLNTILGLYFSQLGLFFGIKFLKDVLSILRSFLLPTQYSAKRCLWVANNDEECFEGVFNSSERMKSLSPFPGVFRYLPLPRRVSTLVWRIRRIVYTKATLRFHIHKLITLKSPLDVLDLASVTTAIGIVVYHTFVSKPWYLTNFLGFSFCYGSLQIVTPTTGSTGTLLLCALFVYDIYFVFFTPMMVMVATKLDVPIKLLFPRPDGCILPVGATQTSAAMQEYVECLEKKRTMAMLGLGDIVIPGMILAFALRFDLYLFYLSQRKTNARGKSDQFLVETEKPKYASATGGWGERFWTSRQYWSDKLKAKTFPKTYFHATLFGYVVGMIATLIVMQVAQHAQPALLYLVPGVLVTFWGTALVKGDLKTLWRYTEATEDEPQVKPKGEKKVSKDKKSVTPNVVSPAKATLEQSANGNFAKDTVESTGDDGDSVARPDARAQGKLKSSKKELSPHELFSFSITLPPRSSSLSHAIEDKRHHRRPSSTRVPVMPTYKSRSRTPSPDPARIKSHVNGSTVVVPHDDEDADADVSEVVPVDHAVERRSLRQRTPRGKNVVAEVEADSANGEPPGKRRRKG